MEQLNMFGCATEYRSSQITKQTRRESNGLVKRDKKREMILEQLSYGPATAREIAEVLYRKKRVLTPARDETAPRLTEMTQEGIVEVLSLIHILSPFLKMSIKITPCQAPKRNDII